MIDTQYSRRLATLGRLVIPKKLRDALGMEPGIEYTFYKHTFEGKTYLCIPVAEEGEAEVEKAKKLLAEAGYEVGSRTGA